MKYARHDGFVERCSSDVDKDSEGNRFMLCHSKGAQYVEYNGQHAVVIPIASILREFCLYCLFCDEKLQKCQVLI